MIIFLDLYKSLSYMDSILTEMRNLNSAQKNRFDFYHSKHVWFKCVDKRHKTPISLKIHRTISGFKSYNIYNQHFFYFIHFVQRPAESLNN